MTIGGFNVAVCDFLATSLNFLPSADTRAALCQHNVESILWRRQATHEANLLKRAAYQVETRKIDSYERRILNRFDHIIAVSDADRDSMSEMTDPERISVVPTGVDLSEYRRLDPTPTREPLIVF